MAYDPNIPQPTDDLSDSQVALLGNFQQLNISFGIDHYTFSNGTSNNGKHNQVTTPLIVGGVHPVTAAAEPKFYGMQDSANLGVIQYSRGPSNAVPTPVTSLQSTAAAIVLAPSGTTNVLDFTGLSRALCVLYSMDTGASPVLGSTMVIWTGTALSTNGIVIQSLGLGTAISGNILQVRNLSPALTRSNVYWTLQFLRTS